MTATTRRDRTTAAAYAARLTETGAQFHARAIDYAEFDQRQRATWDAIHARGERFAARVHAVLRGVA